jgi:hypothetical protein
LQEGPTDVFGAPFDRTSLFAAASAVALGVLLAAPPAHAQGKLDARFTATLAGVPIGKGALVIDVAGDQFTVAASGRTTGLLRVFASGQGSGASRGDIVGGLPVPASYAANIQSRKKNDEVRITLTNGNVRDFKAEPPSSPDPDRVPVTAAHRRGVIDPMTASLVQVPGNGSPISPEACRRSASIFDGRMRYDLKLEFKRMESVKTEKGYSGPVVVCATYYTPIAGHIPDRAAIKYLARLRSIEVWFAPLAGTRMLVPYRISIPTPLGLGVVEATQFVSAPQPPRPTPTNAKTQ